MLSHLRRVVPSYVANYIKDGRVFVLKITIPSDSKPSQMNNILTYYVKHFRCEMLRVNVAAFT